MGVFLTRISIRNHEIVTIMALFIAMIFLPWGWLRSVVIRDMFLIYVTQRLYHPLTTLFTSNSFIRAAFVSNFSLLRGHRLRCCAMHSGVRSAWVVGDAIAVLVLLISKLIGVRRICGFSLASVRRSSAARRLTTSQWSFPFDRQTLIGALVRGLIFFMNFKNEFIIAPPLASSLCRPLALIHSCLDKRSAAYIYQYLGVVITGMAR